MIDVLSWSPEILLLFRWVKSITKHRVCFAWSCLAICENGAIESWDHVLYAWFHVIENFLLFAVLVENTVEFGCHVVSHIMQLNNLWLVIHQRDSDNRKTAYILIQQWSHSYCHSQPLWRWNDFRSFLLNLLQPKHFIFQIDLKYSCWHLLNTPIDILVCCWVLILHRLIIWRLELLLFRWLRFAVILAYLLFYLVQFRNIVSLSILLVIFQL